MLNPKSDGQDFKSDSWVEIGKIVSPQGLKGEVRVYPDSDFPERFEQPGQRWLLRPGETEPQPIKLERGYCIPGKKLYAVKFVGIDNGDMAEALRGCHLVIPEGDRPKLGENEYHILDLINLQVFNQQTGENIGVVIAIAPAGNDLLEVKLHPTPSSENTKTVFIPFVREIVPVVDIQNNRLEIDPPAGLLEI